MEQIAISLNQIFGWSIGISLIVACLISALWSIYFNRIKEGQKAEFQKQIEEQKSEFAKEIENLKAKNDKLNYISKTQFDAEFKIYQELSEPIYDMFFEVLQLFPIGIYSVPEDEKERKDFYEKRYNCARNNFLVFQKKLYVYAPFIPKHIYDMFDNFKKETSTQISWYPDFILNPDKEVVSELKAEKRKCWERTIQLQKQYEEIIIKLREYLQTLQVTEVK